MPCAPVPPRPPIIPLPSAGIFGLGARLANAGDLVARFGIGLALLRAGGREFEFFFFIICLHQLSYLTQDVHNHSRKTQYRRCARQFEQEFHLT
jgi:hypothetical protein